MPTNEPKKPGQGSRAYWVGVAKRAWAEVIAASPWSSSVRVACALGAAVVATLATWWWSKDFAVAAAGGIVGVVMVIAMVFLAKLITVPAAMHDEDQQKLAQKAVDVNDAEHRKTTRILLARAADEGTSIFARCKRREGVPKTEVSAWIRAAEGLCTLLLDESYALSLRNGQGLSYKKEEGEDAHNERTMFMYLTRLRELIAKLS